MGCCGSSPAHDPSQPMAGGQVVGREGGVAITRDEQRARAAAAAEARANATNTRGQQGSNSKIKQTSGLPSGGYNGRPDLADARTWD